MQENKKITQCAYCKSNSETNSSIEFNRPQEIVKGSNHFSSFGCSVCKDYNKDNASKL